MVVTDPAQDDNPIVFVNEAFQRLTGYHRDEIIGRNCRFLQGPDTDRGMVAKVRTAIERGEAVDVDLLNYRKDGSTFWNALSMSPVRNADNSIRFFFASQMDVSERVNRAAELSRQRDEIEQEVKRRTADLEEALQARTLLLHEVDHRVKNNLNMIGSLIRLQARGIGDPVMAARLETMLERVDALAMVHRQLYQADDLSRFDLGAFARSLVGDVIGASGRQDIQLDARVAPMEVSSADASAIGLVLNEVATNAIKHGLGDSRAGTLKLIGEADDVRGTITVADDGRGLPSQVTRGLGFSLVERLMKQVSGTATWSDAAPGTLVTLTFPLAR